MLFRSICMYELVRTEATGSGNISPAGKDAVAKGGDIERLTQLFFDILRVSGYVNPRGLPATEEKLRRMVRRLDLSATDAELWLGMLRQVSWKLGAGETAERNLEAESHIKKEDDLIGKSDLSTRGKS